MEWGNEKYNHIGRSQVLQLILCVCKCRLTQHSVVTTAVYHMAYWMWFLYILKLIPDMRHYSHSRTRELPVWQCVWSVGQMGSMVFFLTSTTAHTTDSYNAPNNVCVSCQFCIIRLFRDFASYCLHQTQNYMTIIWMCAEEHFQRYHLPSILK